ncbi:unnamed protein product [Rhizopus microsporus]|uniref:Uncharacterized protein n=1 Tax=Rhizopus microsporus TaxID=58291 RepID=A0A1X0SFS9_RHIZD|nr:hypothetical protein BCV71DRAFT_259613 [Rhizopus microsporus]
MRSEAIWTASRGRDKKREIKLKQKLPQERNASTYRVIALQGRWDWVAKYMDWLLLLVTSFIVLWYFC